jgi:hypothetical protein
MLFTLWSFKSEVNAPVTVRQICSAWILYHYQCWSSNFLLLTHFFFFSVYPTDKQEGCWDFIVAWLRSLFWAVAMCSWVGSSWHFKLTMFPHNIRNWLLTDAGLYSRKMDCSKLYVFTDMPNTNFGCEYSVNFVIIDPLVLVNSQKVSGILYTLDLQQWHN